MGGSGSGRKAWKENPKPRHDAEAMKLWREDRKAKTKAAKATGMCTRCLVRAAEPDPVTGRSHVSCVECRDARYDMRLYTPPTKPWCEECLCFGHRTGCPTLASIEDSCCNRVVAMIEKRLAELSVRRPHDKASTELPRRAALPDTVESGRSRDEGLPESGPDVEFPGLPILNHG